MADTFEPGDIVEYANEGGIGIVLNYEGPDTLHVAWVSKPSSSYWKQWSDGFLFPGVFKKIGHIEEPS